jgi:acyl-coenzyme A synthetase/AMP-(fatty) acid ligase
MVRADVHLGHHRAAQGRDPQPRRQHADRAGHGAGDGLHARRHRAAGDAAVPRQLAVLRQHLRAPGRHLVIDDRRSFDPEALLRTLAEDRVTFTSLVPTHYIMMLALPPEVKARHDLSAVGKLMISSAPARQETKRGILELFPNGKLYELYGSTEAGWVTLLRPTSSSQARLGGPRVGRLGPIRLLDQRPRGARRRGGRAVLAHRLRVRRLLANPEKTAEAFRRRGARWATWRGATRTATSGWWTARAT